MVGQSWLARWKEGLEGVVEISMICTMTTFISSHLLSISNSTNHTHNRPPQRNRIVPTACRVSHYAGRSETRPYTLRHPPRPPIPERNILHHLNRHCTLQLPNFPRDIGLVLYSFVPESWTSHNPTKRPTSLPSCKHSPLVLPPEPLLNHKSSNNNNNR